MTRNVAGVRWRDGGWEARCNSCFNRREPQWWPLTDEFWIRRRMARCRACWYAYNRGKEVAAIRVVETVVDAAKRAEARRAYNREWMRRRRDRAA